SLCAALAKEIDRQGRAPLPVGGINTGPEAQKAGGFPAAADGLLRQSRWTYALTLAGLMCIPPLTEPPAPRFALTSQTAARNGLAFMSMGMSADFESAIKFGATHVRVGSAIFGERSCPRAVRSSAASY